MPKTVKQTPGNMTVVDIETGKEEHKGISWGVMPPAEGKCQICAAEHDDDQPHNQQSLYYQMTFNGMVGRSPTWADAMAHCSDKMKRVWTEELKKRKAWSEPPEGEEPIKHCGVE